MVASLALGIYFLLASKLSGSWLTHYQNTNSLYKIFDTDYAQWISKVLQKQSENIRRVGCE